MGSLIKNTGGTLAPGGGYVSSATLFKPTTSIPTSVLCLLQQLLADLVMGSLIKNAGGTLAPGGGYVAGRAGSNPPQACLQLFCCR
jgi:cystathionine beta-lyase family protein involved in aluminum resistance